MKSIVEQRGKVAFPAFIGERVYMREFRKQDGLPPDLTRWQATVDAMLEGVDTEGPIYLMVDQGLVKSGATHRRGGVHIDGYWHAEIQAHGGGGGMPPHHKIPTPAPTPRHVMRADGWDMPNRWKTPDPKSEPAEAIVLASDVIGCRAFAGEFDGHPAAGGDCSHIDTAHMEEITMQSGLVYAGNVAMLHESIPIPFDCLRTVVRLNVPGWHPAI